MPRRMFWPLHLLLCVLIAFNAFRQFSTLSGSFRHVNAVFDTFLQFLLHLCEVSDTFSFGYMQTCMQPYAYIQGYLPPVHPSYKVLAGKADVRLLKSIMTNPSHVLSKYLPKLKKTLVIILGPGRMGRASNEGWSKLYTPNTLQRSITQIGVSTAT